MTSINARLISDAASEWVEITDLIESIAGDSPAKRDVTAAMISRMASNGRLLKQGDSVRSARAAKQRPGRQAVLASVCSDWVTSDTAVMALIEAGYSAASANHAIYYYTGNGFLEATGRGKDKLVRLAQPKGSPSVFDTVYRIAEELEAMAVTTSALASRLRSVGVLIDKLESSQEGQ